MGWVSDVGKRIREFFKADKENLAYQMAKGASASSYPVSGFDILQAYGYDVISDYLRLEHDLLSRFVDYEEMDDYPELSAAIDIYADDATVPDTQLKRTLWVEARDRNIEQLLDDLYHRTLRADEDVWEIARTLVKYGNDFEEILVTQDGVRGLNFLPPPTVRRIEGPKGELFGFVQDFKGRFGYCLARGSRVWGVDGLREIQEFEDGKAVLGYKDGQPVPLRVKKRHTNGTKRVFKVRTLHREVYLTEDHPVLVEADGSRSWVKVKDLKIVRFQGEKRNIDYTRTSKLVIGTRMPKGEVPEWSAIWKNDPFTQEWGDKGSPTKLDLPSRPTPDFCRLFGFLLGDGWLEPRRVSFARGVYPELNDYYDGLFRALGVEPTVVEVRDGYASRADSVQLSRLLLALGWIPGCDKKRVPGWVYGLPEEHREAFLTGFMDADGWVNHQPSRQLRHHFEIANYDLARDLKNLIDGLGYYCGNIGRRQRKPGTVVNGKVIRSQLPCFNVTYSDRKFEQSFVAESVLSISYYEDAEVYDLEVDDEAHNFVADGVVVHNSPQEFQQILAMRTAQAQGNLGKSAGLGGLEKIAALEGWEVTHFRLRGKHRRSLYGYSVLEPARWIWKRLMLLEDAALIFRLQRAPERYAFYVDVGDLPPLEALAQVNRIRQQHKKRKFYNPTTGKLDLKWEPLSQDDDFWVPTRAGADGTRIEVLGSPSWQHMDDIEYFRDKLFAAIKVPKAYMGQEEGVARAVLSSEDVRFARTVLRLQRAIRTGMAKVGRVHLSALNIDPEATEWDLVMTVPSSIFELAQLEVRNARADLANRMRDFVSLNWILTNVFGLNDTEVETIIKQRKGDVMRDSETQSEAESAAQKKMSMSQAEAEADINDQFGPPPGAEGAPPPEDEAGAPEESKRRLAAAFVTETRQRGRLRKKGPITEQELFRGSHRETEKRAEGKLEKLLQGDRRLEARLKEIGGMLHDLAGTSQGRR